jgi:hypothetical protein
MNPLSEYFTCKGCQQWIDKQTAGEKSDAKVLAHGESAPFIPASDAAKKLLDDKVITQEQYDRLMAKDKIYSDLKCHSYSPRKSAMGLDNPSNAERKLPPSTLRNTSHTMPLPLQVLPSQSVSQEEDAAAVLIQEEDAVSTAASEGASSEVVSLRLGMDFPDGPVQEEEFKTKFIADVASALGAEPSLFAVQSLTPGSVIVALQIKHSIGGVPASSLKEELLTQALNQSSKLYQGKVTCHLVPLSDAPSHASSCSTPGRPSDSTAFSPDASSPPPVLTPSPLSPVSPSPSSKGGVVKFDHTLSSPSFALALQKANDSHQVERGEEEQPLAQPLEQQLREMEEDDEKVESSADEKVESTAASSAAAPPSLHGGSMFPAADAAAAAAAAAADAPSDAIEPPPIDPLIDPTASPLLSPRQRKTRRASIGQSEVGRCSPSPKRITVAGGGGGSAGGQGGSAGGGGSSAGGSGAGSGAGSAQSMGAGKTSSKPVSNKPTIAFVKKGGAEGGEGRSDGGSEGRKGGGSTREERGEEALPNSIRSVFVKGTIALYDFTTDKAQCMPLKAGEKVHRARESGGERERKRE